MILRELLDSWVHKSLCGKRVTKNDNVVVFFGHEKMFKVHYEVKESYRTIFEISHLYFSDYVYVYRNLEGYAKMSTMVSYG